MGRRLLYAGCVLVATLGAVELGLRLLAPDLTRLGRLMQMADDPRMFVPRPGALVEYPGTFQKLEHPVVWRINGRGTRGPEPGITSDRFRILIYGDSEAFGWGVAEDQTIGARMELIDRRVETVNLGVPGYNAMQVGEHIRQTVPHFGPDLVIYLINKNDSEPAIYPYPALRHTYLGQYGYAAYLAIRKQGERTRRHSAERLAQLESQLELIVRHGVQQGYALMLVPLRWETQYPLFDQLQRRWRHERVRVVWEPVLYHPSLLDHHLMAPAYRYIAQRLCSEISGVPQGACTPPR